MKKEQTYRHYVLFVLLLVYIINFVDRQILSILAEDIKADLGLTDAQLGFLYGTAFAIFYAIFGIPLGRLADNWNRRKLISIGLGFWSLMTSCSGLARNFFMLGAFRIGVGVGEAAAAPAGMSMLSDYYASKVRATALALYSSGIYIGAGIGLIIGGLTVDQWQAAWPNSADAPFGLKGWQAAYIIVGLPGLLMALWVWTLREPVRGTQEGIVAKPSEHPFAQSLNELLAMLPLLNIITMRAVGFKRRDYLFNMNGALAIVGVGWLLVWSTGDLAQWLALGVGCYATLSWMQVNRRSDTVGFGLMMRTPSYVLSILGFSALAFVLYGISFWGPPFFQRVHGLTTSEAGSLIGVSAAVGGGIGIVLGGVLSDWARNRWPAGRLYVSIITVLLAVPCNLIMLTTNNLTLALVINFFALTLAPMWIGAAISTVSGLVLPRLRGLAVAFYILSVTFIGLALGPYCIGLASRIMSDGGMSSGEALRVASIGGALVSLVGVVFLALASRSLPEDERTVVARARALGEEIEEMDTLEGEDDQPATAG